MVFGSHSDDCPYLFKFGLFRFRSDKLAKEKLGWVLTSVHPSKQCLCHFCHRWCAASVMGSEAHGNVFLCICLYACTLCLSDTWPIWWLVCTGRGTSPGSAVTSHWNWDSWWSVASLFTCTSPTHTEPVVKFSWHAFSCTLHENCLSVCLSVTNHKSLFHCVPLYLWIQLPVLFYQPESFFWMSVLPRFKKLNLSKKFAFLL